MKSLCFAKRARNLVPFVWSSCHCGCQREGSYIKREGGCPVSSFATLVETQKKRHLEHDNFISHINLDTIQKKNLTNPRLQHSPSYSVISNHKAQFVTLCSSPCTRTFQIVWS